MQRAAAKTALTPICLMPFRGKLCRPIVAALSLAIACVGNATLATPDGYTKSVTEGSRFYRLVAHYMHGQEKVDFDIVVGCGVRSINYRDNDSSFDDIRDPLIFAKPTGDGGAVMQIVSDACRGETTDSGEVPPDFLPGAVWFDDKSDLSFGIGYTTEDAFENPRSKLKFLGAQIHPATADEWQAYQPLARTNLMRSRIYTYRGSVAQPNQEAIQAHLWDVQKLKVWRPWLLCTGIKRVKLSDPAERAALAALRPAGNPRFWMDDAKPETRQAKLSAISKADGKPGISVGAHDFGDYQDDYQSSGFPTRAHGGKFTPSAYPAEVFPFRDPRGLHWLTPAVGTSPVIDFDIDLDGGKNLGFIYCYSGLVNGTPVGDAHLPGYLERRFTTRIDGISVEVPGGADSAFSQGPFVGFFEGDQYYYFNTVVFSFQ
jgi:hypothetical protein